jgi:hypothetical protein
LDLVDERFTGIKIHGSERARFNPVVNLGGQAHQIQALLKKVGGKIRRNDRYINIAPFRGRVFNLRTVKIGSLDTLLLPDRF